MSEKGTFLKVTKQLFSFKNNQDLCKVMLMLLLILAINQNVIEVYNHKFTNVRPEYLIH